MCKITVEPDRSQITRWRMRVACWITKATKTHKLLIFYTHCFSAATMITRTLPHYYVTCTLPVLYYIPFFQSTLLHSPLQKLSLPSQFLESSWNLMAHGDAREGKWRGNWRMKSVATTLTLVRNTVYPALLPLRRTPRLLVVERTDTTADFNGLVRFAERRNLVSACVPSHFKRSLPHSDHRVSQFGNCCNRGVTHSFTQGYFIEKHDYFKNMQLPCY
jgi:hypothetical protein